MQKYVYQLIHSRRLCEDIFESKLLGFFSSKRRAKAAIPFYRTLPGFCDYPNDFRIERYEVDYDALEFE
jgi:hypothetical protein